VGVSLGIERLFLLQEELGRVPAAGTTTEVLVAVFGPQTLTSTLAAAHALREAGIKVEVFAEEAKLAKQFKHANARGYPWLVLVGPEEAAKGVVSLKNLRTGAQESVAVAVAVERIRQA
jgi:histidyl-tRNA synthetase